MNKRRGVKLIPLLFMVVFLCFSAKARAEVTTGWNKIDGKYYYYSADGYFYSNGNYSIDGKLYAFDENGVMLTGWIKNTRSDEDGIVRTSWYHASPGGVLDIGWKKINDKWYYFYKESGDPWMETGKMVTGNWKIDGKNYYFGTDGAMKTNGWIKHISQGDGTTYTSWVHASPGGALDTGWKKIENKWYYFSDDGWMYIGRHTINGKLYYLGNDGAMKTDEWIKETGIDEEGNSRTYWLYASSSGALVTGWQQISDKWYYFDQERTMKTGWLEINGRKYYLGTSGVMQTGWTKIDGVTYFFKDNGVMASSQWVEGYWLNNDGTWTYKYKASWKKDSNGWRYEDTSGWYARNATITIDGKRYTFDANGYWVQ